MLADELRGLQANEVQTVGSGVAFTGDTALAVRVNRRSRLASRVLVRLAHGRYRTDRDLHKIAAAVAWEDWFDSDQTLRVDTRALRASIRSLNIATLRVKDGIVDRLRELTGTRPDIDTISPQVRVFCFLDERYATLYLDTSGDSLFKRGWRGRDDKGEAPLKENLAAGLLALSGWRPGISLVDPFCGSGTIVIEAAGQVAGTDAGGQRRFGYENLRQGPAWPEPQAGDLAAAIGSPPGVMLAGDIDPAMIALARANAARAGIDAQAIRFTVDAFEQLTPPTGTPGMIVSNPPYGERMAFGDGGDDETALLAIGRHLREHWSGWTVCLLSGDLKLPGRLGLKAARRIPLYNGPIETRLFIFEMR